MSVRRVGQISIAEIDNSMHDRIWPNAHTVRTRLGMTKYSLHVVMLCFSGVTGSFGPFHTRGTPFACYLEHSYRLVL